MEDELLVGPDNFSQPHREFNLLQDDFLDLAGDDDADHNEMALCLASNSVVTTTPVANQVVANEALGQTENFISGTDNPVQMKLDNLDAWDQDVLLSNAGLPETNPLLLDEDLDHSVGEDFQKMLNDWENHIGSLQGSDMPDVDMSTLVPGEVATPPAAGGPSATNVNVIKTETMDDDEEMEEKPKQQLATVRDEQGGGKMTLGQMALAGIVISSGPGDYFETYEVLEATDADNLLEQFEEISPDLNNDDDQHTSNGKTSNIFKAVQNHFAASAAAASNNNSGCRRLPRIVPSQRIKEAIPREIIERIKASSQKSRTIAIIEPVNNKPESKAASNTMSSPASSNIQVVGNNNMINKPSIISKSHVIQPAARHTRFAEAANSLQKTKTLRLISTATSSHAASAASPQQVQISLDHDYCSSSSKLKRNRPLLTASTASRPLIRLQPTSVTKPSSIVVSSPMTSKSIVRVSPPTTSASASNESVITMPIAVEVTAAASNAIIASSPLSSPARKDSGLESGEASDTSESQHATSASSLDLYSKVPNYLTSVSVQNADSRSVAPAEDDAKSYDRLPAYVKGVPKRISTSSRPTSTDSPNSIVVSSGTPDPVNPAPAPVISRMRTRGMRSRSSSCSASSSDNDSKAPSTDRMATRSRTSAVANSGPSASSPGAGSSRRRRQSSSSSSSSSTDLRSSRQHQHKKRRSWRKQYSSDRSRSPQHRRTSSKQQRQVEERRVVYVGRISEGTTRADLRKRFQVFGPIEEISVHFRDRGDNYGFITFLNKKDAFSAIEHGNDDTSYPKVDLCFGGRRAFCKEKYADLDSGPSESRRNGRYGKSMIMMQMSPRQQSPRSNEDEEDFDALLKQARAGIRKS